MVLCSKRSNCWGGTQKARSKTRAAPATKIADNPGWTAAALLLLGRRGEAAVAFSQLVREVSEIWCGDTRPNADDVRDWFVNAYPFRNAKERDLLDSALREAVSGLNAPLDGS